MPSELIYNVCGPREDLTDFLTMKASKKTKKPQAKANASNLRKSIEQAINASSAENGSNTPDYILAQYLTDCLVAFDSATRERDRWYGHGSRVKDVLTGVETPAKR